MSQDKLDKVKKKLNESVLEELDAMDAVTLNSTVSAAIEAINQATAERDANPKYQEAKLAVTDLSAGLKDTRTYQNAKIFYALYRLRELRGD